MPNHQKKTVTLAIIGAGNRGSTYAAFARGHPDRARVVAVAEPRTFQREQMQSLYGLPAENVFSDWRELAQKPRLADAAVVATQDAQHVEPAITFATLGYHLLLEKPMAPTLADCERIIEAVRRQPILFAVCHVLRYRAYTRKLKELIDGGAIGEVVNIQHLEPVIYWHQAHSYVRGNWRNETVSSPMLLAKSCHDIDWISHIMGRKCTHISSFGSLKHFRKAEKPARAGLGCLECEIEPECPYSAPKLYLGRVRQGNTGWPTNIITDTVNEKNVLEALRTGPYGRCVYECDNDVVDNQIVNMQFEGKGTASFTMMAFTADYPRQTRIFGTHGEIYGNSETIEVYDFVSDERTTHQPADASAQYLSGHGGGDYALMEAFISAVATGDETFIISGLEATLESHRMVFAAERARRENRVVAL